MMLVTKALSQDVMVLAFVPLFADSQGVAQPPLQSPYIQGICLTNVITTFGDESLIFQVYNNKLLPYKRF